jgi:hypothetical protein
MKIKEKLEKNEKYIKYKEYKESFKKIWDDPKIGSIIKLSMWFIPILLLAFIVRINEKTIIEEQPKIIEKEENITNKTVLKQFENINSYEETITVETDIIETLKLTHAQDEDLILYNNQEYYNRDNLYLLSTNEITDNKIIKNIIYFNINNIKNRLENEKEDYITVYKDNSYIISYTLDINEIPLFEQLENIGTANITISGKENINKIEINFENYNIRKITYELENINNIDKININMEVN